MDKIKEVAILFVGFTWVLCGHDLRLKRVVARINARTKVSGCLVGVSIIILKERISFWNSFFLIV